jgi:hypothetical protein
MKPFGIWHARLLVALAIGGALVAGGGTPFAGTDDALKIPADFQHGYLANSLLVTKEPNKIGLNTGNHLIYVNPVGFARLTQGGSAPYPDGTVFVDDVREYSADDGFYRQGGRKFLTMMIKDSRKYASTGGWGFQAWSDGIRPSRSSRIQ